MCKFDVSTDSTCDLYKDYVQSRRIWFVPLTFSMEKGEKQEEYLDQFESYDDYVNFYKKVREGAMPRTAMLNYMAHFEHFTKMAKAGVKEVLHFSISSGLARTVEVAKEAAEEVKKTFPDFCLYSVDPLTATVGQGALVSLAADLRDEGKTAKEAYEVLMETRFRIQHCIIPNDLFYLKRGGRVSGATAVVGTILQIKPMLSFDTQGKLASIEKCRGMKKAFFSVLEHLTKAPLDDRKKIVVVHTDNEKEAQELASLIEKSVGVKPEVVIMGPTIGAHVGPSSVSCCWISKITRADLMGI